MRDISRAFAARYPGTCPICDDYIPRGAFVVFYGRGSKKPAHQSCVTTP